MKDKIEAFLDKLRAEHNFNSEFYLTYMGYENDGDISDWHDNHFDDNVSLGFETGKIAMAEEVIHVLTEILKGE